MHKHGIATVAVFAVMGLLFLRLPPMVAKQDSMYHTYRGLVEVNALAKQQFVEPITDDRLVHGAIRGMMLQLDPYSAYISPNELPGFQRRSAGEYIGIGVEVGMHSGRLTVIAPVEGGPAASAGVHAGDVIVAIDGKAIEDLSVFNAMQSLVGPPHTQVTLRVQRAGDIEPRDITVTRGAVSIRSVRGVRRDADGRWDYAIDPGYHIAYVRLRSFHEHTARDFDAALRKIVSDNARGLILDLRNNPGGLLDQAIAVADRFLRDGPIVSTVTRRRAVHEYRATPPTLFPDGKLMVLINRGSASSSEIVAGALQDRARALIIGERSFGKGSVQHMIFLESHDAAIKLTVAYYCLPSGRIIHRSPQNAKSDQWGIKPDVEVARGGSSRTNESGAQPSISDDPQLQAALTILRQQLPPPNNLLHADLPNNR